VRADQAVVQLKAGTAAATGSQTIPTPDSGFSPLWVILVANGTTQIIGAGTSAGQWTTSTIAPFFPNLESIRPTFTTLSNSVFTFSVSVPPMGQLQFFQTPTGATSAYTGTIVSGVLVPPGSVLGFYNSSTGAMTLNSNNFNTAYGSATASIVIPSGGSIVLTSDGTSWNGTGGAGAIGAAVRPQTAAGVGQWQYVPTTGSGASTYFTLPAGGSWAYMVSNSGAGTAGIAAGGSNVFGPFTASNLISFCWRIA
jgi:hypothetical protein